MTQKTPSVSAAVTAAGRLLRDRPAAVLPAYLLASAVATVARVPLLVGAGTALAVLDATGRIGPVVRAIGALERSDATPTAVSDAVEPLASPEVLGLLGVGAVLTVVVAVVVRPIAVSITQSTAWAVIDDADEPLTRGVAGATRWQTFLGLTLIRGIAGVALVGLPGAAAVAFAGTNVVVSALAALVAVVGGVGFLLVSAALAFAGPAVVVDGVGTVGAIRHSLGFIRRHVGAAVGFLVVAAGLFLGAGVVSAAASALNVARIGGLIGSLLVAPAFDLAATGLYAGVTTAGPRPEPAGDASPAETDSGAETGVVSTEPESPGDDESGRAGDESGRGGDESGRAGGESEQTTEPATGGPVVRPATDRGAVTTRIERAIAAGLRAFAGVVPAHPGPTALAAATFLLGGLAGWRLTAQYGVRIDPPASVDAVFGAFPLDVFVNIAANNWLVAVGGTYGGLGFGLPAAADAITNGVLIGALAGVFDPVAFVGFVAPHGVIELPTLVVVWGFGLHLGVVGWRAVRGRIGAEAVAAELRRGTRVLVGAAVLLVIAAAIEAFLTPRLAGLVV